MTHPISSYLQRRPRQLSEALAHCFMAAQVTDQPRQRLLGALYNGLTPAERLACMAELHEARRARRGAIEATLRVSDVG